jgi:hypothetical protein
MIRDIIEFRMPRSDDEREPRKLVWNTRFQCDRDIIAAVTHILTRLIEKGVPDDQAVERALVVAEKMMQGMLDRGWAAMTPTLDERYDDRRVGFVDTAE